MSYSILNNQLFKWDAKCGDIKKHCDVLKKETLGELSKLESVSPLDCDVETFLKPLEKIESDFSTVKSILSFYSSVFPNKELREESYEVEKDLTKFSLELKGRTEIFCRLKQMKSDSIDDESKFLLEKMIKSRERLGLGLSIENYRKVNKLNEEIKELCLKFNKNVYDDKSFCSFTSEELAGVQEDLINSFDKTPEGKYIVTAKYPHVFPCMKYASEPETRKKIEIMFNSRCIKENTELIEKILMLRQEKAQLLGFSNHSSFVLDILMAKNLETINGFYQRVIPAVNDIFQKEKQKMLQLKSKHCQETAREFDGQLYSYDISFYNRMMQDTECDLDQNTLKEYFPSEHVVSSVMEIYQKMLRLKFERVSKGPVWHPDVSLFCVRDESDETSPIIGYFYVDIYPREGKYPHAACFSFKTRTHIDDYTVSALVANFSPPCSSMPSLLTHSEVVVFFHEFGHVMHSMCAKPSYASFGMYGVERDFIETPSQMLENWSWDVNCLVKISSHYSSKQPLSSELIQKLIKTRKIGIGFSILRQILFGTFDLKIHTETNRVNTRDLLQQLTKEFMGYDIAAGSNWTASFLHLTSEYDSQYYGYLWSLVYSCDLFDQRFSKNVFDPQAGSDYRKFILSPGASKKASQILIDFLGREPREEAFFQHICK